MPSALPDITPTYLGNHGYLPCVVVPVVYSDGVAKAGERSVQLLCQNKLMTQQSVGVCKAWIHLRDRRSGQRQVRETDRSETGDPILITMVTISHAHLDGSLKELDGDVMFPLQTETISCNTPGLQREMNQVSKRQTDRVSRPGSTVSRSHRGHY